MPEYVFHLSAVAEAVIEADNEAEAREKLGKISNSEHDWHDCEVMDVELNEEG